MERFVQMKLFPKSFHHLERKLRVQRIDLARFTRSKMNDQKRDNRHKKEGDDFLNDTAAKK